jgi:hypothetical protein
MKKIDFNKEFNTLPNIPAIEKRMYEVLAENISMSDSKIVTPRKAWEWAITLHDKKELELVSEDISLLRRFIEEGLQSLPNFITAQLLYCLELE